MAEITSMMEETRQFPPPKEFVDQAYIKSRQEYETMWKESIENPEKFWGKVASCEVSQLGNTTTLADQSVVDDIVKGRL